MTGFAHFGGDQYHVSLQAFHGDQIEKLKQQLRLAADELARAEIAELMRHERARHREALRSIKRSLF